MISNLLIDIPMYPISNILSEEMRLIKKVYLHKLKYKNDQERYITI